ncbi:ImmA/IrrE family metallo-endopeptidase [Microbulbifer sp. VAAF005]|uniref:ImmA/IrrE family metallo-endopeptidase n=1 Tax=Microbulbifer sp. VAAF005 TaxID=3034230 RepID=UPI0024AD0164|nr:ImmA/IrrE family metallo-endopeptidase [Microbulbifer sp. VAAF005]WHI44615.1 ImmA/IrrE family metallo-endopeptidase [Microbulbifer sp. VAAF005]
MNEAEVRHRARTFIAKVDISDIQNDLSPYVSAANAKLKKDELGEGESGYTITKPNGKHIITINSQEIEERQRFTVCHEIAHIVLGLESSHEEIPSWSYAKRHPNEVACDTFAAELLMPYQQWLSVVPREGPSLELIQFMADQFRTSFPAAASRYASLSDAPCAFVTMDRGAVRYTARSTSLRQVGAWIPPKSTIPAGSVAHRIRSTGKSLTETDEVTQDAWFDDWEKGLYLWELSRHYSQTDTTISLLWLEHEELPQVEVNRFNLRVRDDGLLPELTGELPWPGRNRRR